MSVIHPRRVGLAPDPAIDRLLSVLASMRAAATRGVPVDRLREGAVAEHIPPAVFAAEMERMRIDPHSAGMPRGCLIDGALLSTAAFAVSIDGLGMFDATYGAPLPDGAVWSMGFLLHLDGAPGIELYPSDAYSPV